MKLPRIQFGPAHRTLLIRLLCYPNTLEAEDMPTHRRGRGCYRLQAYPTLYLCELNRRALRLLQVHGWQHGHGVSRSDCGLEAPAPDNRKQVPEYVCNDICIAVEDIASFIVPVPVDGGRGDGGEVDWLRGPPGCPWSALPHLCNHDIWLIRLRVDADGQGLWGGEPFDGPLTVLQTDGSDKVWGLGKVCGRGFMYNFQWRISIRTVYFVRIQLTREFYWS